MATLEEQAEILGADLVLEGGGVKGIGLAGAVLTLSDSGYVFPRVAGTSAGAIVAALVAAYQRRGIELSKVERDMRELNYSCFMDGNWAERHLGLLGKAEALLVRQGVYRTDFLRTWLHGLLDPIDVRTFADLKITDDPNTSLPPVQRYRLVVHTCDLSRGCLVRLPWDLPAYLLSATEPHTLDEQVAAIDSYSVVDAVCASMSIPFFFRPFVQHTARGDCTWVDGGLLQNFPITVFNRSDGAPPRWPTFGVKLSARPALDGPDRPVNGDVGELRAIARTALGEWDRYPRQDEGVGDRTVWVDTMGVSATDFGLSATTRDQLFVNGQAAATAFLAAWEAVHPVAVPA